MKYVSRMDIVQDMYTWMGCIAQWRKHLRKGPRSLKGLVKLWAICVKLVLPGLQIDSKADHNPHAN